MTDTATVPARFMMSVVACAERQGVAADALCRAVGIDPASLRDPDAFVSMRQVCALFEEGARATGDDAFGMHVAERARLDVPGHALLASATLRTALDTLAPYLRAIHAGEETSLTVEGEVARFTHRITDPRIGPARQRTEGYLAVADILARRATGTDAAPRSVSFQHPRPRDISEHLRIFRGAPLHFDADRNEIRFGAALLDMPFTRSDPGLSAVLDRHIRDVLTRLSTPQRSADDVRRAIAENLRTADFGIDAVARRLGTSVRTLQRRLRDDGTSHQALLDAVRRELSTRYLDDARLSIKEIAASLGFADVRAFYRAFRRWYGTTPAARRKHG